MGNTIDDRIAHRSKPLGTSFQFSNDQVIVWQREF